eukprot:758407-Hanusia_phi.AAC.7
MTRVVALENPREPCCDSLSCSYLAVSAHDVCWQYWCNSLANDDAEMEIERDDDLPGKLLSATNMPQN